MAVHGHTVSGGLRALSAASGNNILAVSGSGWRVTRHCQSNYIKALPVYGAHRLSSRMNFHTKTRMSSVLFAKVSTSTTSLGNFALRNKGLTITNCYGMQPRMFIRTSATVFESGNDKTPTATKLHEANAHAEEQEREHCFSESHFRDTVDRLNIQSNISLHEVSSSNMQTSDAHNCNGNGLSNYEGHQYGSYGSVSLSSVMQSNVPEPYQTSARGSPSHMNMPGGGGSQQDKYLAGHIKDVHPSRKYSTSTIRDDDLFTPLSDCQGPQGDIDVPFEQLTRLENPCPQGVQGEDCDRFKLWLQNCARYGGQNCNKDLVAFKSGRKTLSDIFMEQEKLIKEVVLQSRKYSTSANKNSLDSGPKDSQSIPVSSGDSVPLSQKDRLKRAVKDYGATVVVFHVTISLMSLGTAYLAVSSGLDVVAMLEKIGVGEAVLGSRLATGASTFVVAYAVHKVFAPVRIATTLTATPFIVRHLRRIGFLKPPKSQKQL